MNIKEVSEKTGLTKKAIRYYEDTGIIQISKNPANQYRDYDDREREKIEGSCSFKRFRLLNQSY